MNIIKDIKSFHSKIKIIILTASKKEEDISYSLNTGAEGYLLKDNIIVDDLIIAIKCIHKNFKIFDNDVFAKIHSADKKPEEKKSIKLGNLLSEKEIKIIQLIIEGKNNKEISSILYLSEGTIKNSITKIIAKLNLRDKTQLAVFSLKNNIVS